MHCPQFATNDANVEADLHELQHLSLPHTASIMSFVDTSSTDIPGVELVAVYAYDGARNSPSHLTFPSGALILANLGQDGNPLWYGRYNDEYGWFPPSYCRLQRVPSVSKVGRTRITSPVDASLISRSRCGSSADVIVNETSTVPDYTEKGLKRDFRGTTLGLDEISSPLHDHREIDDANLSPASNSRSGKTHRRSSLLLLSECLSSSKLTLPTDTANGLPLLPVSPQPRTYDFSNIQPDDESIFFASASTPPRDNHSVATSSRLGDSPCIAKEMGSKRDQKQHIPEALGSLVAVVEANIAVPEECLPMDSVYIASPPRVLVPRSRESAATCASKASSTTLKSLELPDFQPTLKDDGSSCNESSSSRLPEYRRDPDSTKASSLHHVSESSTGPDDNPSEAWTAAYRSRCPDDSQYFL